MEQMADWMEANSEVKPTITLTEVMEKAEKAMALQSELDELAAKLADKERELSRIQRYELPDMMEQLGLSELKLEDGTKLKSESVINASITAENKPAAFRWLRENDFDGIIKSSIKADFGKGEISEAERVIKLLDDAGVAADLSESVHAATLKAFVKERLEAGDNIPVDTFGIFEFKQVKFTKPKRK